MGRPCTSVHVHGVKQAVHINVNLCPYLGVSSLGSEAVPELNLMEDLTFKRDFFEQ